MTIQLAFHKVKKIDFTILTSSWIGSNTNIVEQAGLENFVSMAITIKHQDSDDSNRFLSINAAASSFNSFHSNHLCTMRLVQDSEITLK